MLGAIIGDIVGSAYEFNPTNDYNFEMFKNGSGFTDDTICTIAMADAILKDMEQEFKGLHYGENLHDWCRRYPTPKGSYGGRFGQWVRSDHPQPYNSYGNGSAMRVSPIGMWYFDDPEAVLHMAEVSASCTHNHPEGIKGAQAVAEAIGRAIVECDGYRNDDRASEISQKICADVLVKYGYPYKLDYEEYRGRFDETCQGTVPVALRIIQDSSDFEDAIRRAVSLAADADTLGAIVGSIAEHIWGIPDWMKNRAISYLTDEMRDVVERFYEAMNKRPHYRRKELEEILEIARRNRAELLRVREDVKKSRRDFVLKGSTHFMNCTIAGTHYIKDQKIFYTFGIHDLLELRHEDNPFDADAVALYFKDKKVGYVPRHQNHALAAMLKTGWNDAFVAYVEDWQGCGKKRIVKIEIRVKAPAEDKPYQPSDEEVVRFYDEVEDYRIYASTGGRTGTIPMRVTPDRIDRLGKGDIFVFGSNERGAHEGGAARVAYRKFGAQYGQGDGLQGQSYAINTMSGLIHTAQAVERFIRFATKHPELRFFVTAIGCGIAGYTPLQIAPLFRKAIALPNVFLPLSFWEYFWLTTDHGHEFRVSSDWEKWDN